MFGGYGSAFRDYYDFDADNRARYRNMNEKSAAATRREEEAVEKFQHAREQMENRGDLVAGTKHTVELLKPSCHLTGACWKSFRKHVLSCEGWVPKRREKRKRRKREHNETRKGKVYFVDVVYDVPKEKQAMKRSVEAAQGSSKASSSGMAFGSGGDSDTSSGNDAEASSQQIAGDTDMSKEEDAEAPAEKKAKLDTE